MTSEATAKTHAVESVPMKRDAVWTFSLSHTINDVVTTGLVPALLYLYKMHFHLTYTKASLIILVSYLTSSVMQPIFGAVSDKRPTAWLLPTGVVLSTLGLALTGLAPNYVWVLIFVAISGLGSGAFHPEASRGTHFAAGSSKGLAQAIFQVGGNFGQSLGPLVAALLAVTAGVHGLIGLAILSVVGLLLNLRILPWYKEQLALETVRRKTLTGENLWGAVILLVGVIILRSWCQTGMAAFIPVYYKTSENLSVSAAEILNFLFLFAGAVGTFIGGAVSDKVGPKRILVASMLFAAPFAILLPHLHGWIAIPDLFIFGFFVLASFAVSVLYMQKLLPRNLALASGLSIGFGVGAGGIGATCLGYITDHFGISTVFLVLSVLPIAGAVLSFFLPGDKKIAH